MRAFLFIAILALGCKSEPSEPSEVVDDETSGGSRLSTIDNAASQGGVCRSGERSGESINRECAEGLSCCYPCGMQGCDFVCATSEQCESWSRMP